MKEAKANAKVLPERTLLLPLARSVLRLNRLEGGRLKSERDPCENMEVSDGERSGVADPSVVDDTTGRVSLSWTSFSSGACRGLERDAGTEFSLVCFPFESGWGVFWWRGAGLMVDDGGVAGSGGQGTTTADRLPAIGPPSACTTFLLLSGLGLKKPTNKRQKHNNSILFTVLQRCSTCRRSFLKVCSWHVHSHFVRSWSKHLISCWVGRPANKGSEKSSPLEQLPVSKLNIHKRDRTWGQESSRGLNLS